MAFDVRRKMKLLNASQITLVLGFLAFSSISFSDELLKLESFDSWEGFLEITLDTGGAFVNTRWTEFTADHSKWTSQKMLSQQELLEIRQLLENIDWKKITLTPPIDGIIGGRDYSIRYREKIYSISNPHAYPKGTLPEAFLDLVDLLNSHSETTSKVEVSSLSVSSHEQTRVFTGNAVAVIGDIRVSSDKIVLDQSSGVLTITGDAKIEMSDRKFTGTDVTIDTKKKILTIRTSRIMFDE